VRYSEPYSTWYGDPGKVLAYVRTRIVAGGTIEVAFMPRDGTGDNWFGVYLNGRKAEHLRATGGKEAITCVPRPWGSNDFSVHVIPLGGCGDPAADFSNVARGVEAADSQRVTLQMAFSPAVLQPDSEEDAGYTSTWSLSGIAYASNVERVSQLLTRGRLEVVLDEDGTDVSVTLNCNGKPVASGTAALATLPASVTLAAENGSGLTGAVTIAATVQDKTFDLYVRWPTSMRVLRDTSDPPSTVRATIAFDGRQAVNWTEPSDLAAGTYYYRLQPISDTGQAGTATDSLTAVVAGPPDPPTALAYSSGTAAATVCSFTASPTTGRTYRAYMQTIGASTFDFEVIAATAASGATTITLPAIVGYPGTARVVVRAVSSGGVEEQNLTTLELEYDAAGARVAPRPNPASLDLTTLAVTSGLTASIAGRYDSNNEPGTATRIKLFKRAPGGAYDYANPDDNEALANLGSGVKGATFSVTFATAGWYYLRALAYTAASVPSTAADCPEIQVYVSDAAVAAPTNVQAHVSRG
jgi:hypothetical protein